MFLLGVPGGVLYNLPQSVFLIMSYLTIQLLPLLPPYCLNVPHLVIGLNSKYNSCELTLQNHVLYVEDQMTERFLND